ncbi:glycoside hydrolase family 95-like protein [Rapidithrix thailandica]|uniref:Glycoside hydrolase family 95-like protein n=1 Tax=Rapidithrix thailandica TaxID=413964 RepID=A0AAW9SF28_9BACT
MKIHFTVIYTLLLSIFLAACQPNDYPEAITATPHDLSFSQLPSRWDEALPLGNGMVGALLWQKGKNLRLSLDRADLWDLRPMENLDSEKMKFHWVYEQWKNNNYREVQQQFDVPYDKSPAPSKIPAGALEFDIQALGEVASVQLHLKEAISEIHWKNGAKMLSFVHATEPIGWFYFEGAKVSPEIIAPAYSLEGEAGETNPVEGQDLRRLGYPKGKITKGENSLVYEQEGWGGFRYQVTTRWQKTEKGILGCWSIHSEYPQWEKQDTALEATEVAMNGGFSSAWQSHRQWWKHFWSKSSIELPDKILEKQWYREIYKFGSAARQGAPPISLQAVWTADNGKLPPWKGDFHHDLNTQLSYWPAYSGNHLEEEQGFIDWLWKHRNTFKEYTKNYFETNGLNVPGVTTLEGQPMGGWIQYSFGPTVSAWLAQHFYWHWRYSMDPVFLEEKAYPWLKEVAIHFDELSVKEEQGMRKLPISSSPEIHDNSREAWFGQTTNFDLALIRWTFDKAAELATELGKEKEARKWKAILAEWPELDIDPESGLTFAPEHPYESSHRHFSHLMGFHPLGLVDWSNGAKDREIIRKTLNNLEEKGSDWWVGYSFSWLGNLKARAMDGEGAAKALKTFAKSFCLPNSFHVNGDQSGKGFSKFTYRPFTLEGNFAFASGIQEMLIQSHSGVVRLFPAIPADWQEVAFEQLRAQGAFVISARKQAGKVVKVEIQVEKGGVLILQNPFDGEFKTEGLDSGQVQQKGERLEIETKAGMKITLKQL